MAPAPVRRRFGAAFAALALTVGGVAALTGSAPADEHPPAYLSLGDSVVFGYITSAGFAYGNADNFVGYPSYVGDALRLGTVNAACPGEATGGFISLASPIDNGCRAYRAHFPLHSAYAGSQLDDAVQFLKAHRQTKLVTIGLGANDAFLVQRQCAGDPRCLQAAVPALLQQVATNLTTIVSALRAAPYRGVLLVTNYYSVDYTDAAGTALTQALNAAIAGGAKAGGATVADEFTAFQAAAAVAGGKTCNAGLLNAAPANQLTCDVHPSQSGQQLLARTIESAYWAARGDD